MSDLILYTLANPSDPYTFYAPSVEVAGMAAAMLSTAYGAIPVNREHEASPVLSGWDAWMTQKGIDDTWMRKHILEIADAMDSFLIGNAKSRADAESMLSMLPDDKKDEWIAQRQARNRSSLTQIGEKAYALAKELREAAV